MASAGTTGPLLATVPSGFVWVVREISVICGGTGADVEVGITGVATIWNVSLAANAFDHFSTRQVLEAGDELAFVAAAAVGVLISGYQLVAP